ncbi:hypothetical protein DSM112329_02826 [Paraconexibacter sp. AEG42_29]|uniref:Uncharacterized protein n=2 Tax=Paraconexibacter sp. AEG42_29 TaxID=2997339 RepID=A0AAU7AWV9_9ACTN
MEEVAVERLPNGTVRLLATPAVADGVALGDVAEVDDGRIVKIVARTGLLEIQVYLPAGRGGDLLEELRSRLGEIGGAVQGGQPRVIVCHVPVEAGFAAVEAAVTAAIGRAEGVE